MKKLLFIILFFLLYNYTNAQNSSNQKETIKAIFEHNALLFEEAKQKLPTLSANNATSFFFKFIDKLKYTDTLLAVIPEFLQQYNAVEGNIDSLTLQNREIIDFLNQYSVTIQYDKDMLPYGLDPIYIDYNPYSLAVDVFYSYCSPDFKKYIDLQKETSIENIDHDGLLISHEELGRRIVEREKLILESNNIDVLNYTQIQWAYMLNEMLFSEQENSQIFENGFIKQEYKNNIELFSKTYPNSKAGIIAKYYLKLLKQNKNKYSNKIKQQVENKIVEIKF